LQLDEIGLVLDVEGRPEPSGQRGISVPHLDVDFADRRMGQKFAAEECVVLGLDGAPITHALDPFGSSAAGPMQTEPMAAGLEPAPDDAGLRRVGVGAGDVADQQLADRQEFLDIREVVGDRGRDVPLGEQPEEPQTGIVVVVPAHRTGRKTAGNEMGAAGIRRYHRIASLLQSPCGQFVTFPRVSPTT
jgi:hypothetical protein